jgi:hypothetical protein
MVYHYTVQEFEKSNTAMTTGEDYPPSIFGIMIGREGGTYLPRLGFAIYIIRRSLVGETSGLSSSPSKRYLALHNGLDRRTLHWLSCGFARCPRPRKRKTTGLSSSVAIGAGDRLDQNVFLVFFARTIQASKFPIPKEAKEEGDGNNA